MCNKTTISFSDLRDAIVLRTSKWNNGKPCGIEFAAVELAGEAGEVCNAVKKLSRLQRGMVGGIDTTENIAEELADLVICADLLAMEIGINLGVAVANKFNTTSIKYGFSERLELK